MYVFLFFVSFLNVCSTIFVHLKNSLNNKRFDVLFAASPFYVKDATKPYFLVGSLRSSGTESRNYIFQSRNSRLCACQIALKGIWNVSAGIYLFELKPDTLEIVFSATIFDVEEEKYVFII